MRPTLRREVHEPRDVITGYDILQATIAALLFLFLVRARCTPDPVPTYDLGSLENVPADVVLVEVLKMTSTR